MEGLREGGSVENGPKRREPRRLGHLVSFFFYHHDFYILTIIEKLQRLRGTVSMLQRGKWAQTMQNKLFGPLVRVFFFNFRVSFLY